MSGPQDKPQGATGPDPAKIGEDEQFEDTTENLNLGPVEDEELDKYRFRIEQMEEENYLLRQDLQDKQIKLESSSRLHEDYRHEVDLERKKLLDLLTAKDEQAGLKIFPETPKVVVPKVCVSTKPPKIRQLSLDDPNPSEWIEEVKMFVNSHYKDEPAEGNAFLLSLVERDVKVALRTMLDDPASKPVDAVFTALETLYKGTTETENTVTFFQRVQTNEESVKEYAIALMDLGGKWRKGQRIGAAEFNRTIKTQFAYGVSKLELRRELFRLNEERPHLSFIDLMQKAETFEGPKKPSTSTSAPVAVPTKKTSARQATSVLTMDSVPEEVGTQAQYAFKSRVDRMEEQLSKQTQMVNRLAKQMEELIASTREQPEFSTQIQVKKCTYCGKKGHISEDCYSRKRDERKEKASRQKATSQTKKGKRNPLNDKSPQQM